MGEYAGMFVDAVDEGLSVLGPAPKKIIYGLLKSDYGITKEDLPEKFGEFSGILKEAFGPGADSILHYIINRFYVKLRLDPPSWTNLNEAVETVQRILNPRVGANPENDLVLFG
jgi:hypothetical protein